MTIKNKFITNTFQSGSGYMAHVLDPDTGNTTCLFISPSGTVQHVFKPSHFGAWINKKDLPEPVTQAIIKALNDLAGETE